MNKKFLVSESEKNRILSMHNDFAKKNPLTEIKKSIHELVLEIKNELNFQKKVHLHAISLLEENQRNPYIVEIRDNYILSLFGTNDVILENYENKFNNVIYESTTNISEEIDEFNEFLVSSLLANLGILSEQSFNPTAAISSAGQYLYDKGSQVVQGAGELAKSAASGIAQAGQIVADKTIQAGSYVVDQLSNAVNYIKSKGVTYVFETLRNALMSGVGTAIQIALSFTGAGAIANEIAWGIITLYDGYQYFVNNTPGSLANLVIDLICLLTAGAFGKTLKGFVNYAGTSVSNIISKFMQSGVGQYLKPIVQKIQGGLATVSNFLGSSSKFMKDKMGITWVAGILDKVKGIFMKLAEGIGGLTGGLSAGVATSLVRAGVQLGNKFEVAVFNELARKTEQEIAKEVGKTVTQAQIKAAEKYATEYLRDKPTAEALSLLDKKFGTNVGDVYALYVDANKLASHNTKVNRGITAVDVGTDALRGDVTTNKADKYGSRVKKDVENLTTKTS